MSSHNLVNFQWWLQWRNEEMETRGSPWENGYIESFNGKLRDELLNREVFTTLIEAKILIEEWRTEYNQVRPHSALITEHLLPRPLFH